MPMHRRTFLASPAAAMAGAGGLAASLGITAAAQGQYRVEIGGIGGTRLPIAVARLRDEDRSGQALSAIIRADLERSGVFTLVDGSGALDERSQPAMADWRARAADALVAGFGLAPGRRPV